MPMNFDYPSHVVARELEEEEPFTSRLSGPRRIGNMLAPEAYAVLLDDLGYTEQIVRLQVYAHHLDSREHVVEWVKGTLLTDYEARLGADLFPLFLERYRARLLPRLRDTKPFFYPFKRILMWARR
jgi:trans-aconitate 2-methyltransferase